MTKFQAIVLGLFVVFAVGGLIFFSVFKGSGNNAAPSLVVWGTIDQTTMSNYLDSFIKLEGLQNSIQYYQISPANFYQDYIEALASGQGPDLLLISQDQFLQFSSKVYTIPYSLMSQSTFKNSYLSAANIYLGTSGFGAVPFSIDPMVMYWNKDIFTNALLTAPPHYWSDITTMAPKLTARDASFNITTSAVGLGEYANIDHAKDILSLLLMDSGSPITAYTDTGLSSALSEGYNSLVSPFSAVNFYTGFANPTSEVYSWNRALPDSETLFISNKLGIYFGYASEYNEIKGKNPNLNFDVALMPQINIQINNQPLKQTFAHLYGMSVARSSQNSAAALKIALLFGSANASALWASSSGLPSDRIDTINLNSADATQNVFATSALWSRVWFDPNPTKTSTVFQTLIENITSGRLLVGDALQQADAQLQAIVQPSQ